MSYKEVLYDKSGGIARVTINRPERLNAFTYQCAEELIDALNDAAWDNSVGVIVLGGAGDKAFCVGSDQEKKGEQITKGRGTSGMPAEQLHAILREAPKPVIARVQGYAIGGGNVLATICDLTIASERATFGQVGPKVGSVDPGFGTAYLARLVGEKKAREMWFLCRRYDAHQALQMGLCNTVVPHEELDAEVDRWCQEILQCSPTALAIAKRSFNADSESIAGSGHLGKMALKLFLHSDESLEGRKAFLEKRPPRFREMKK